MRHGTADLARRIVLPQLLVNHLTQRVIVCPAKIFDPDDKLGSHPMNPADSERGPETADADPRKACSMTCAMRPRG